VMTKEHKELSSRSAAVLKLMAEGHTYEQILALNPELTYLDIFSAAREALEVAGEVPSAYEERLAKIRQVHPRAYEKWTEEEDAKLAQFVQSGYSVDEIASQLQRQPGAIRSRMLKRNLVE
jgi:DNA-binding NarL/FixJ family response regulator